MATGFCERTDKGTADVLRQLGKVFERKSLQIGRVIDFGQFLRGNFGKFKIVLHVLRMLRPRQKRHSDRLPDLRKVPLRFHRYDSFG